MVAVAVQFRTEQSQPWTTLFEIVRAVVALTWAIRKRRVHSDKEAVGRSASSEHQRMSVSHLLVLALLALPFHQQSAQQAADPDTGPPQAGAQTSKPAEDLPVSLERIQRALAAPPSIRLLESRSRDGRPLYRVDIEGERIDITSILGKDFTRGPASYGPMTHQEFLNMVTPDDVKGYAPFSNGQGMVVAATSIALQWAVLKAIDGLKQAKDERAKEQARREVQEALEALRKARRAAGLPEK